MFRWEGNNPVHPAVATQEGHALWYCTLACKNIISHPATSGTSSCSLAHLYIVGKLRVSHWTPFSAKSWNIPLVLWTGRDCSTVVGSSQVCWPALNDPMVVVQEGIEDSTFWKIIWTNLLPPVLLIKSLWGSTSVFTESKWCKQRSCSLPCGRMWDATTVPSEWPGLSDSLGRVVLASTHP